MMNKKRWTTGKDGYDRRLISRDPFNSYRGFPDDTSNKSSKKNNVKISIFSLILTGLVASIMYLVLVNLPKSISSHPLSLIVFIILLVAVFYTFKYVILTHITKK